MVKSDSPLANLPLGLPAQQRGWLEGLRYAFDILGTCEMRLCSTLHEIAFQEGDAADVSVALTDAWSVVDAAWRLKRFLFDSRLPNPTKIRVPRENRVERGPFGAEVARLKQMRNGFQHLDTQALREVDAGRTIWGTLRWVALHPDRTAMHTCLISPGTVRPEEGHTFEPFINPVGLPFEGQVDHVALLAFGEIAHISKIVRRAKEALHNYETVLAPQFAGHPAGISSFLFRLPIGAVPAESKSGA